jgi:hypothetical protein
MKSSCTGCSLVSHSSLSGVKSQSLSSLLFSTLIRALVVSTLAGAYFHIHVICVLCSFVHLTTI